MKFDIQSRDFRWFKKNYNSLYKKYGVSFLAISNKKVIGSYDTFSEGVEETEKTHKPGTFLVQECNGNESAYTRNVPFI